MNDAPQTRASALSRVLSGPIGMARKLAGVIPSAIDGFFADQCPLYAAGIAYRVLFSCAPLAIALVSVFGLVLQNDGIREDVLNAIVDVLPVSVAGRKDVENAITAIATPASAAGLVSLVVFVWAATGMMAAIRQGLERAMHVTVSRPAARGKLVDLALIAGAALLVLVTAGITLLGTFVQRTSGSLGELIGVGSGTLASALVRVASFVLAVVVVLLLYRFVPTRGLRIRDGVVGAIVTAFLFLLISLASGVIYDTATKLSAVYGSLTAALVFLYSVYLYSSALLLGAEVAAAWSRPPTGDSEPLVAQLRRAALGIFVKPKDKPISKPIPDSPTDDSSPTSSSRV